MFFACHPLFQAPSSSGQPRSAFLGGRPDGRETAFLLSFLSLSLSGRAGGQKSSFPARYFDSLLFTMMLPPPRQTLPEVFLCGPSPPESPLGVIHSGWQPE